MRNIFGIFCFALLSLASATLLTLNALNYDQSLIQHPLLMVKFYVPDCPHCKQVTPQYMKLTNNAAAEGFSVSEVNCEEETQICSKNSVSAFPTFKLFVEGYPIEYTGGRTSQEIAQWIGWVKKQITSNLAALSPEQIEKKKGKEAFVVAWGLTEVEKKMVKIAGSMSENVKFYQAEQSSSPRIALFHKNQTEFQYPKTFIVPGELSNWAFKKALPIVIPFNIQENVNYILSQKEYKFMLIFMDHQKGHSKQTLKTIAEFCRSVKDKLLCGRIEKNHLFYAQFESFVNPKSDDSTIVLSKFNFQYGYHYQGDWETLTVTSLTEFLEKGRKDELKRAFQDKSVRPSKINYKNAVKLNDENYEEVLQANRLVFVEFYSPDCGHCIKFAPIYDKLAAKFKEANSKVVIAAVDGNNEQEISDSINLRGFPTLKLFVNGEPIDYNGDRSVQKMTEFINGFLRARLIPVESLDKVEKPAVVVWGVSTDDSLIKLSALYTTYPAYRIEGEENSEFKVQIHDEKEVRTYKGKKELVAVADWLDDETAPILYDLGTSKPSRKLEKAIGQGIPILGYLIKNNNEEVQGHLETLTTFCKDKTNFICGTAKKGDDDYEDLVKWFGDSDSEINRLVYIDPHESKGYIYEGYLAGLTANDVKTFIEDAEFGKLTSSQEKAKKRAQEKEAKLQEL